MNLWHLAIFHAVADNGSISAGAVRLNISQPAVTRQLRELEARLGTTLFDRLPRGVRLTETGVLLHDYAQRIFTLEQTAESALKEMLQLRGGRLAVGASSSIGMYLLPSLVTRFHQLHPGIEFSLDVQNTKTIEQHLLEHQLALGFIEGPVESEQFEVKLLRHDEIVAVATPQHPLFKKQRVSTADLAAAPVVLRETGSGTRTIVEQSLAVHGLTLSSTLSMSSTEAIKRAVMAGAGIAWLSRLCIADELHSGKLAIIEVRGLKIMRPLFVMWLKDRRLTPAAQAFLELLGKPESVGTV